MLNKKYLNDENLKGFDNYKYNSIDTSWLSNYVMHPFWNYCVKYFPFWLAPNLITFVGFLLTAINYLLIAFFDYDFTAASSSSTNSIPPWVFLVVGINVFVAYTLDGIDGKQARRTGSSNPLGELFDHGLDSYSTLFIMVYLFSLFGVHDYPVIRMHYMTFLVYMNFYATHFEKYNTGVMFLPWAYDFVMWGCSLAFLLAYILGPAFYVTPIFGIAPTILLEIILYSSSVITSYPIIAYNIYKSYKYETGKMRPFLEAARPLFPLFSLYIVTSVWVVLSPNAILSRDPRMFFMVSGTIFSNFCSRLIVAQMSGTRCDGWTFQLSLLTIATIISVFPYPLIGLPSLTSDIEYWILITLCTIVSLLHFHYGYGVVNEMCKHFGIKCFTIKPKQSTKNGENGLSILIIK